MMEFQDQLKLQAYLDGELPESESREWGARLASDPEASALLAELRQTRDCLAGHEAEVRLPETREFFWSKVQREIQRQEAPAPDHRVERPALTWLRRWLLPVSGLAAALLVGLVALRDTHAPTAAGMEVTRADSGVFTYYDYAAGATLVWLSYPAENDIAERDNSDTFDYE